MAQIELQIDKTQFDHLQSYKDRLERYFDVRVAVSPFETGNKNQNENQNDHHPIFTLQISPMVSQEISEEAKVSLTFHYS